MARHQVGHEILLLAEALRELEIALSERFEDLDFRLAHAGEHLIRAVLGRDLQLSADVVMDELLEEALVGVSHHVVKADARADEDLLDLRQSLDPRKQLDILRVVDDKILAGCRSETFTVRADSRPELLLTCGIAEVRGRSADVVYVALEVRESRYQLSLLDDRLYRP